MQRLRNDDGAVAVLVAILAILLFAFGAFAIDISSLWSERQRLHNGADGAALAVAQSCAAGSCTPGSTSSLVQTAQDYADSNNQMNGGSNLAAVGTAGEQVCGESQEASVSLPACAVAPDPKPPGQGWVMVAPQSGTSAGANAVPSVLAKLVFPDYNGIVHTSAIANWGAPAGVDGGIPLTVSECEWKTATNSGEEYASDPPYTPNPDGTKTWATDPSTGKSLEQTILFHTESDYTCATGPSGADNLSGGFGWLNTDPDSCSATTIADDTYDNDTGNAVPLECKKPNYDMSQLIGSIITLPVYDSMSTGMGTNTTYHVGTYASFYLTGYFFPGGTNRQKSSVTNSYPCGSPDSCISGFFVDVPAPGGSAVGNGTPMGATVVALYK